MLCIAMQPLIHTIHGEHFIDRPNSPTFPVMLRSNTYKHYVSLIFSQVLLHFLNFA